MCRVIHLHSYITALPTTAHLWYFEFRIVNSLGLRVTKKREF